MAIALRPYQQAFVADIRAAWQHHRCVLGVAPTGGGKTVCFASLIHDHGNGSAAVVHRRELVAQISMALARLGVKHRIIAPASTVRLIRRKHLSELGRSYVDPGADSGVISVQTLTSKSSAADGGLQRWLGRVTMAVFDEGAHYVKAGHWGRAVESLAHAKTLFVTATPERADGKGLGAHADGFATAMVETPSVAWLISEGYLCKFKYLAPDTDLDVSGLRASAAGDFNSQALRKRVVESHLVGDAVSHYQKFIPGKRTIVFATDVATAGEIASAFCAAGVTAVALCGKTDMAVRERELGRFESGEVRVLVNVDLFDEGYDCPAIEAVLLARPTQSLSKYLQMCGRALRIMDGKPCAYVLDMVRNWERHGMPNWPRQWTLDARESGQRGSGAGTIPQKVCGGCTQPYEAYYLACPYCGHVPQPAGRATPKQVDGDLTELDVDAMLALFDAVGKADMPDSEYAVDQITRHIPKIGRGADMRRHQAGRTRRATLRELMAWWSGMQPDERPVGEVQKRFYFRFGVDVATALTLNARETDALIGKIQTQFTKDLMV